MYNLKKQINFYLIEILCDKYDQEKSKKLLSDIAYSYEMERRIKIKLILEKDEELISKKSKIFKLENEIFGKKNEIFLHQVAVYSDGKYTPFDFLEEAIKYFAVFGIDSPDYLFYKQAIDYCFKEYPLYAAKTLTNLATKTSLQKEIEIALAIVKTHNLLEQTINNPEILQELVKTGNDKTLKVLAHYDVDFSDPALMDSALATQNLACIHFMLSQQKDVLQQRSELYDALPDLISDSDLSKAMKQICSDPHYYEYYQNKKYNLAYAKEVYKALLRTYVSNDIQPLKDVVFNFDADMQQLQSIQTVFDEICKNTKKACSIPLTNIKNAVDEAVVDKYPEFLDSLIKKINKINNKSNRKIDKAFNAYEDYADGLTTINLGTGCAAWCIFQGFITNPYLAVGGVLGLIWHAKKQYAHFKERHEKYYEAQKKVGVYKNSNYLEGYLCGRQNQSLQNQNIQESSQEIGIEYEQQCEENIYKGDKLDKAIRLSALVAGFWNSYNVIVRYTTGSIIR